LGEMTFGVTGTAQESHAWPFFFSATRK
jgi:hypothetical protein